MRSTTNPRTTRGFAVREPASSVRSGACSVLSVNLGAFCDFSIRTVAKLRYATATKEIVRFSVLMPFFNEEKYICRAIESVLNQTFTDFELIVIDDASTDGSLQRARSYEPSLRILCQSRQGPEVARNKAAAIAKGEYLVFLDADDFFFPFALAILDRVIRHFDSSPLVLATLLFFQDDEDVPVRSIDRSKSTNIAIS